MSATCFAQDSAGMAEAHRRSHHELGWRTLLQNTNEDKVDATKCVAQSREQGGEPAGGGRQQPIRLDVSARHKKEGARACSLALAHGTFGKLSKIRRQRLLAEEAHRHEVERAEADPRELHAPRPAQLLSMWWRCLHARSEQPLRQSGGAYKEDRDPVRPQFVRFCHVAVQTLTSRPVWSRAFK
eukprot:COSAG02_NODE_50_length_44860_cov_203.992739_19_plen_184_part_00